MPELFIVAHLTLQSEHLEKGLAAIKIMVEKSQAEAGVIHYQAHQSIENPQEIAFYEKYQDKAAIEAHSSSVHAKEFFGIIKDCLAGAPQIKTYQLVS